MIRIGIQGKQGSFSEIAALQFIKNYPLGKLEKYELLYLISSDNVLRAIENNTIDFGILAIENAQGGIVIESLNALAKYRCHIVSSFPVLVRQHLLALPNIISADITEIHSHEQALRQCRHYLATHFSHLPLIEERDTAEAAERLQKGELPKTAAVIANKACATLCGLQVLQADINDLKDNLTLFLAVKDYHEHEKK